MASPFEKALKKADSVIAKVMMSDIIIKGEHYSASFDEVPREMESTGYNAHLALNGAYRTFTLYKYAGYKPTRGDIVEYEGRNYTITGFGYQDGLLILQVE